MIVLAHDIDGHEVRSLGGTRWRCDTCGQEGDTEDERGTSVTVDAPPNDTAGVGVAVHVEIGGDR